MKVYIPAIHLPKCGPCSMIWDDYKEPACFCRVEKDPATCPGPSTPDGACIKGRFVESDPPTINNFGELTK